MNNKTDSAVTQLKSDPQDGFDLIEYPVDYNFKALCHAQEDSPAIDYILSLIEPVLDEGTLIDSSTKSSRTGKFESVTVVVRINGRDELESIYKLIAQSSRVAMTL